MRYLRYIIPVLAVFFHSTVSAFKPDTTILNDTIKEVVIVAKSQNTTSISKYGEILSLSSSNLNKQVKILGNADAFRFIQLLPGVATNNDYTTGSSVQGCEFSHSIVEMDAATLYYPYHLMGIFSTCNNDHFSSVALEKSIHTFDFPNRLGGRISIKPKTDLPQKFSGSADAGLISSGLSLSVPLSPKCAFILSGRLSYLNTLYSSFLEDDENKLKYDFYDTNITFLYKKDASNALSINTLFGRDRLFCLNKGDFLEFDLNWDNFAVSTSWEHIGKISHKTSVAYSRFKNNLNILMPDFNIGIPTEISQFRLNESLNTSLNEKITLHAGASIEYLRLLDNTSTISGENYNTQKQKSHINALESRIFGNISYSFNDCWNINAGVKLSVYHHRDYNHFATDPGITLRYKHSRYGAFVLHGGIYHQYIHQTGFSSNGLPTDFWFLTDDTQKEQKAYGVSSSWTHRLPLFDIDFSIEAYYKRMLNQPEYNGSVMSVLLDDFNAKNNLIISNGYNTGIDIMLQKRFGKFSGWISYSLGFARRKIPALATDYVPSSRESLHNLSVTTNYKHNAKFSYAANFVFASGSPTTPVKSMFMIGENVLCEYGEYNSWHLPHYHRLDLSATYTFPKKENDRLSHSLNLSIVNTYANKNVIMQYFTYDHKLSSFKFKETSTLFRMLPSISYRLEF